MELSIFSRDIAAMALRGPNPYTHVISISDWQIMEPVEGFSNVHEERRLFLAFDDISTNPERAKFHGYVPPSNRLVQPLIAFARKLPDDGHLLVHCEAGISRSTAAAFIVRAIQRGPGNEDKALLDVIAVRKQARPNLLMVAIADEELGRDGALMAALTAQQQ